MDVEEEEEDEEEDRGRTLEKRDALSNSRIFVERALLYNDGGFDVSPDGKTLCACAEFWLDDGVHSVMETIEREEELSDDDDDDDEGCGDEAGKDREGVDGTTSSSSDGSLEANTAAADGGEGGPLSSDAAAANFSSPPRHRVQGSGGGASSAGGGRPPPSASSSFGGGQRGVSTAANDHTTPDLPPPAYDPKTPPPNLVRPTIPPSPPSPPGRRFPGGIGHPGGRGTRAVGVPMPSLSRRGVAPPGRSSSSGSGSGGGGGRSRWRWNRADTPDSSSVPEEEGGGGGAGRYVPHVVTVSLDTTVPTYLPQGVPSTRREGYTSTPPLGSVVEAAPLDGAKASGVTCVKFSPSAEYCLLGYGVRENASSSASGSAGQERYHPVTALYGTHGGMAHVSTMLSGDDDVNIARFHPESGYGFVYGTKQGRVRVLSPRPWNYYYC